ncbi:MAG TPA: response regulator [Polyangiaceae bacterium]|jgi:two-component system response regulator HydG|nr:response regulator [Polyangiaceae bacterium]
MTPTPSVAPATQQKILVADDDEGVRAGLVANLELEGYQIVEARDGAEAIALIGQQPFDLIISDVVMPLATGVDVLAAVRQRALDTPFILISAFVSEDLVLRALSNGLFAMLYKPFAMDRILEVVARALKRNAVLLVDDTHSYVSSLAEALRAVGMRVETCEDGKSALDFAQQNGVDVCVLDLVMQPLDGLETCEALQRLDAHMDFIAITGLATNEQVRGIARRGVATCLRKPFEVRELLTAIARVRAAVPVRK